MDFKVKNSFIAGGITIDAAMLPIYDAAYLQGNMINPNVSSLQDGNYLVYDGINKIWTYGNGPTGPVSVFGTNFGEYLYWNSYTGLNGAWTVGSKNITLGYQAGYTGQGTGSVAIGNNAGSNIQGTGSVAIGNNAGTNAQGTDSVAIGNDAGAISQSFNSVAIGYLAGYDSQDSSSVAIGNLAGVNFQGSSSVAIGDNAGANSQGSNSVAIGYAAGVANQGSSSVAIGYAAGNFIQATNAVAIGNNAGNHRQGTGSIAIGYQASSPNQSSNSTIINSSGIPITGATAGFYIAPVRDSTGPSFLYYNNTTKEITSNSYAGVNGAVPSSNFPLNVNGVGQMTNINFSGFSIPQSLFYAETEYNSGWANSTGPSFIKLVRMGKVVTARIQNFGYQNTTGTANLNYMQFVSALGAPPGGLTVPIIANNGGYMQTCMLRINSGGGFIITSLPSLAGVPQPQIQMNAGEWAFERDNVVFGGREGDVIVSWSLF